MGAYRGAEYILPYADRPIAKGQCRGRPQLHQPARGAAADFPYLAASFFTIDLAGMRGQLEQMPWIAHAEVRRVWAGGDPPGRATADRPVGDEAC